MPDLNPMQALTEMMSGVRQQQAEEQQAQAAAEKDELGNMTRNLLVGFLQNASPNGTFPDRAEFDKRFRQSNSPAREILANVMQGISSSLTGQKFMAVREKAWQQQQQQFAMQQEAQQAQQAQRAQMMSILQREVESRRQNAMQEELARIRTASDSANRNVDILKFATKYNLDAKALQEQIRMNDAKLQKDQFMNDLALWKQNFHTGNPLLDAAVLQTMNGMEAAGFDMSQPAIRNDMWKQAFALYNQQVAQEEATKAANRPERPLRLQLFEMKGPDGNTYSVGVNPYNNQVVGGTFVGRELTAGQIDQVNSLKDAAQSIRTALTIAQNSPDALGTFAQMVPPDIRARLGKLSPNERNIRAFFNNAVAEFIRSKSGLAVTNNERAFLMEGIPSLYEKPEAFYQGAFGFLTMVEAAGLRTQYGLNLDLTPTLQKFSRLSQEWIKKKGTAQGMPIPSAEDMIQDAAQAQGLVLRRSVTGGLEVANAGQ